MTGNNAESGCKTAGKIGEIPGKIVDKSEFITFYRHSGKGFAIIAVTVGALTITAINDNVICKIKAELMKIFKMKDLDKLYQLLNFKIEWNRASKSIGFSQEAYIGKILSWFNLEDSKMHTTPK